MTLKEQTTAIKLLRKWMETKLNDTDEVNRLKGETILFLRFGDPFEKVCELPNDKGGHNAG